MKQSCIFCGLSELQIIAQNEFAYAIRDKYPVRPLHTLIIPKRHVADIFETTSDERQAMHELALLCRQSICDEDAKVAGFNFGSNVGEAAGQKVFHAHIHLIPRRNGEIDLPPAKAN
ncbi:HIT family protein [Limnohabitans sp. TS-CS-82]|uniref:HIT family protein n=1 Tax=Limnohabitans sp. TS-CS-82 TaxID=2094193 RepID=UPI000CF2594E|nr:HIT family protein [Limnohabitans sp. TS-CS-82]PQA82844.1 HIT family protein [Limnohabitans sp. TS-CS-82]